MDAFCRLVCAIKHAAWVRDFLLGEDCATPDFARPCARSAPAAPQWSYRLIPSAAHAAPTGPAPTRMLRLLPAGCYDHVAFGTVEETDLPAPTTRRSHPRATHRGRFAYFHETAEILTVSKVLRRQQDGVSVKLVGGDENSSPFEDSPEEQKWARILWFQSSAFAPSEDASCGEDSSREGSPPSATQLYCVVAWEDLRRCSARDISIPSLCSGIPSRRMGVDAMMSRGCGRARQRDMLLISPEVCICCEVDGDDAEVGKRPRRRKMEERTHSGVKSARKRARVSDSSEGEPAESLAEDAMTLFVSCCPGSHLAMQFVQPVARKVERGKPYEENYEQKGAVPGYANIDTLHSPCSSRLLSRGSSIHDSVFPDDKGSLKTCYSPGLRTIAFEDVGPDGALDAKCEMEWVHDDIVGLQRSSDRDVRLRAPIVPNVRDTDGKSTNALVDDRRESIPRRQTLEERKQRNREAATRSNENRKRENMERKEALRVVRQRVIELRTIELRLRSENIELRRLLEEHRSR